MTGVPFLDFDGCLHASVATAPIEDRAFFAWLPILVELLADHLDVGLVVHSTWRYTFQHAEIRDFLGTLGTQFLSTTPRGPRQESILWWLQMHPHILDYRVIDDDAHEFGDELAGVLILCPSLEGLRDANVQQQVRAWLDAARKIEALPASSIDHAQHPPLRRQPRQLRPHHRGRRTREARRHRPAR